MSIFLAVAVLPTWWGYRLLILFAPRLNRRIRFEDWAAGATMLNMWLGVFLWVLVFAGLRAAWRVAFGLGLWAMVLATWVPLAAAADLELFTLRGERVGRAVVDEATGRVDLYDARGRRLGHGVVREGWRDIQRRDDAPERGSDLRWREKRR